MARSLLCFRFGVFEYLPVLRELRRKGVVVSTRAENLDLLGFLLENRDRAVLREELLNAIWPGVAVSESVVSNAINEIRTVLGDDGREQKMIRSFHGRSFRFVADVVVESDQEVGEASVIALPPKSPLDSRGETCVQSLRREREEEERRALIEALRETGGNLTQAGLRLHKSRGSVRYQARKHGLI